MKTPLLVVVALAMFGCLTLITSCGGGGGGTTTKNDPVIIVTPKVPSAPEYVTAISTGLNSAKVSFREPVSDGGSQIVEYIITSDEGITAKGTASPITVTGLPLNKTRFSVVAKNAIGPSPASTTSNAVTPTASGSMPYMAKDGANTFSLVQKKDGGFLCQCGEQTREVKLLPDYTYYFDKLFTPTGSDYVFVFATKQAPEYTLQGARSGGEILFFKINKSDFSFTTKSVVAFGDLDAVNQFEDEPFFHVLYDTHSIQYLEKIDFDGEKLRIIPLWGGLYNFSYMEVTKTRIFLAGEKTVGATRVCVKQFDRNYVDIRDSQQRPFEASNANDYTSGFSVSQRGILITAVLYATDHTSNTVLFSMDSETGAYTQIYSSIKGALCMPVFDQQGNILVTHSGAQDILLKISPDGRVWSQPLNYGFYPTQVIFDGSNAIFLHHNDYNSSFDDLYAPTQLKIINSIEDWVLLQ